MSKAMFRLQTILPYVVLIAVSSCILLILFASRPTFTEDVADKSYHRKFEYHKKPERSVENDGVATQLVHTTAATDIEQHFLKEIEVGENTFYKPVNLYKPPSDEQEEKFTIIIQTFNRTDLLMRLLNHYSAAHGVDRIIVVWNTIGEVPPYQWWEDLEPHPAEVLFLEQDVNNVRNRLQRFAEIRTEGMILIHYALRLILSELMVI